MTIRYAFSWPSSEVSVCQLVRSLTETGLAILPPSLQRCLILFLHFIFVVRDLTLYFWQKTVSNILRYAFIEKVCAWMASSVEGLVSAFMLRVRFSAQKREREYSCL